MLQGVVKRGTARALAPLAPYVAGKTGTTEDENDAWFIGFTNAITVAVWVGYDNAGDVRHTLGDGSTGAVVAAPIVASIIETARSQGMSRTELAPPSAQAQRQLSCRSVDPDTGRRGARECLRLDENGRPIEARYRLVSRNSYARRNTNDEGSRGNASAQEPPQGGGSAAFGSGRPSDWIWGGRNWFGGQRGFWNW